MELDDKDIKQLLQDSLDSARAEPDRGKTTQEVNQNRARSWVNALAANLKLRYEDEPDIRVFSKYDSSNRKDFGLNELLFDIVVCGVAQVPAMQAKKELHYVTEALWQVESEFARDSRQALIDFNKLVLGSAHNKLFIGPQMRDNAKLIKVLSPVAKRCSGNVYVSLIPHPAKWKDASASIKLWLLSR